MFLQDHLQLKTGDYLLRIEATALHFFPLLL